MTLKDLDTISDISELHNTIRQCKRCPLHTQRNHAVPGKGIPDSDIMFVDYCPGPEEDQTGTPFSGPSGPIMDELLESIKRTREQVFSTYCICCRSGEMPLSEHHCMACGPYLCRHIMLMKPRVLCTLGPEATGAVFRMTGLGSFLDTMDNMHGQAYVSSFTGKMLLIPFYDLRSCMDNENKKSILFRDMRKVQEASIPF